MTEMVVWFETCANILVIQAQTCSDCLDSYLDVVLVWHLTSLQDFSVMSCVLLVPCEQCLLALLN